MIEAGIYQHYKGNRYEVITVAKHSETQEYFVVYKALYGEMGVWVRPLSMFKEDVMVNENLMKRFKKIDD